MITGSLGVASGRPVYDALHTSTFLSPEFTTLELASPLNIALRWAEVRKEGSQVISTQRAWPSEPQRILFSHGFPN